MGCSHIRTFKIVMKYHYTVAAIRHCLTSGGTCGHASSCGILQSGKSWNLNFRSLVNCLYLLRSSDYPVSDSKGHRYFNYQIADGKTFHLHSIARRLRLSSLSLLSIPKFCHPHEMYDTRSTVCAPSIMHPPRKLHS